MVCGLGVSHGASALINDIAVPCGITKLVGKSKDYDL
jgi:hypothetical protein